MAPSWSVLGTQAVAQNSNNNNSNNNGNNNDATWTLVWDIVKFTVSIGVTLYATRQLIILAGDLAKSMETTTKASPQSKASLAKRLKRPEIEAMEFDSYEERLMVDVVGPDEIQAGFADIGGLDDVVDEVKDNVVLPMQIWNYNRKSYNSSAISPCPTGVLLYGNPGTGKSLIAKAIAKEAGATFISITASSLLDKFLGESDRLASALFKLGRKLAPSIIFIDEIETLLRKRGASSSTEQTVSSMQGVFLTEWDGLTGARKNEGNMNAFHDINSSAPVVVLGATNRPGDLDPAFLRRMPVQIQTKVPDLGARLAILRAQLRHEQLDDDVNLDLIAQHAVDFTGSDLKEVIRLAELYRTKEITNETRKLLEEAAKSGESDQQKLSFHVPHRLLKQSDFLFALKKKLASVKNTGSFIKDTNATGAMSLDAFLNAMAASASTNESV